MKKGILLIIALLITSSTFAYATIQYNKQVTTQHEVSVGNTVKTLNGLIVTEYHLEQGNLTFLELDGTHYLTYTYDYEILAGTYDIAVSSITDDVVITDVEIGERIAITFMLNQEKTFVSGELLAVEFLFELVEYTTEHPFMIKQASEKQLQNYFQDISPSAITEMYNAIQNYTLTSLTNFYAYTSLSDGDLNHYYQDETYTKKLVFE